MRSSYKLSDKEGLYFITSSIVNWIPIFKTERFMKILIDSIKFCQENKELKIFAYVILFNHFHMLITCKDIRHTIQALKGYTAREIVEELKRSDMTEILKELELNKKEHKIKSNYQVWQESYHPQMISTDYMFQQKVDYIHMNPVKHGYVCEPEDWKYSSYRYYNCNEKSIMDITEIEW
jgi:putative transposase